MERDHRRRDRCQGKGTGREGGRVAEAAGAAHAEGGEGVVQAPRRLQDRTRRERAGRRRSGRDVLRREGPAVRVRDARLPERRRRHRQRDSRQDQVPHRQGRRRRLRDGHHLRRRIAVPDGDYALQERADRRGGTGHPVPRRHEGHWQSGQDDGTVHRLSPREYPADGERPPVGARQLGVRHRRQRRRHDRESAEPEDAGGRAPQPRVPLQAGRAGQPGTDQLRRAVRPHRRRLPALVHRDQQPAPAADRAARPLLKAEPVPRGGRGHARHSRTRAGREGVPHQPVRAVAGRAHHAPGRLARREAVPHDRTRSRRLFHLVL